MFWLGWYTFSCNLDSLFRWDISCFVSFLKFFYTCINVFKAFLTFVQHSRCGFELVFKFFDLLLKVSVDCFEFFNFFLMVFASFASILISHFQEKFLIVFLKLWDLFLELLYKVVFLFLLSALVPFNHEFHLFFSFYFKFFIQLVNLCLVSVDSLFKLFNSLLVLIWLVKVFPSLLK